MTLFAAAPGVYRQMLDAPDLATGFATPPPRPQRRRGAARSDPPGLGRSHGQANLRSPRDVRALHLHLLLPDPAAHPGRIGYPQPGRRIAVLEEDGAHPVPRGADGVLAVSRRDPGLMLGYWSRPDETAAAFRGEWFVTGDRARMDKDGAITYLGRADDLMNAGGYRVSPAEVEAALLAHPGVADAAAVDLAVAPAPRSSPPSTSPAHGAVPRRSSPRHCAHASRATNAPGPSTPSTPCRAAPTASSCAAS